MIENPAGKMALPDKNIHGSAPDDRPLSHPFCMGSPFSVLFLQSVKPKKYHTAPHPDHRLPRHHDGQDTSQGILLPLLLTEILQSP